MGPIVSGGSWLHFYWGRGLSILSAFILQVVGQYFCSGILRSWYSFSWAWRLIFKLISFDTSVLLYCHSLHAHIRISYINLGKGCYWDRYRLRKTFHWLQFILYWLWVSWWSSWTVLLRSSPNTNNRPFWRRLRGLGPFILSFCWGNLRYRWDCKLGVSFKLVRPCWFCSFCGVCILCISGFRWSFVLVWGGIWVIWCCVGTHRLIYGLILPRSTFWII